MKSSSLRYGSYRKAGINPENYEFPTDVQTVENNWKQFAVDCDGRIFTITVKPKMFKKLEEAQANFPMWVAAIAGKMGEATPDGFVLADPAIQVFEKKPLIPQGSCT
ncbi:fertility inhibition FinO-like protein [Planktothrix agardhii]|uniref:fertility inhibition FinO-like protein n=1 Tax=Planktothrix agardhii TaxID=1160 RepID=UPI001F3863DD|nr:fertility inhibition FinO-like protein [Planktothrix agardhii]